MARWVQPWTPPLSHSPCPGTEPDPVGVSPEARDTFVAQEAGLRMREWGVGRW